MTTTEMKNMIALLNKERDSTFAKLKSIENLLAHYESILPTTNFSSNETFIREKFPFEAPVPTQISFLLKNSFKKLVRLPEIQERYTQVTGSSRVIANIARRMKSEGTLIAVKYNKSNLFTYWGLKEWVKDGIVLDDNLPDNKELQFYNYEVIESNDKDEDDELPFPISGAL